MPAEKKLTACISTKNTKKFATLAMTSIEIKSTTKLKEHVPQMPCPIDLKDVIHIKKVRHLKFQTFFDLHRLE